MKAINVTFDDSDMDFLLKVKDGKSWREFILECAKMISKKEVDNGKSKN